MPRLEAINKVPCSLKRRVKNSPYIAISINNLTRHCGLDPQSSCEEMPYQVRHDRLCLINVINQPVIAGLTRNLLARRCRIKYGMTGYV